MEIKDSRFYPEAKIGKYYEVVTDLNKEKLGYKYRVLKNLKLIKIYETYFLFERPSGIKEAFLRNQVCTRLIPSKKWDWR